MGSDAEIRLTVRLDEDRLAESIEWHASESDMEAPRPAAAFTLSIWDPATSDTMGVDLWTKRFPVDDMGRLVGQTLVRLGGVFARATKDEDTGRRIAELGAEVLARVEEGGGSQSP